MTMPTHGTSFISTSHGCQPHIFLDFVFWISKVQDRKKGKENTPEIYALTPAQCRICKREHSFDIPEFFVKQVVLISEFRPGLLHVWPLRPFHEGEVVANRIILAEPVIEMSTSTQHVIQTPSSRQEVLER